MRRVPWILALMAGLSAWVFADRRPRPVQETAEVSLVEVPVNVTGHDGKPVHGLTAADFEITDDGKRMAIESVDVVDLNRRAVESGLPSDLPAAGRRHILLLFDMSFASSVEIVRSREAAIRFLQDAVAPEDLVGVATASVETGARLQVTFSADRRQTIAAIRKLGMPNEHERAPDPLAFAFVRPGDPFLAAFAVAEENRTRQVTDPTLGAQIYSMMAQQSYDNFSVTRVNRLLAQMDSLGAALNTIEGRKTIIYFSEGFDGRLLVGNSAISQKREETAANNDLIMAGETWAVDLDRRYSNSSLQRELSETLARLRRADCTIYPIDIAGLKAEGDSTLGTAGGRGEDSLFAFASETGGELIKNANDLSAQMRRIAEKTSLTYILSFRPSKASGDGKFHALKVKVDRSGARVSARAGYYEAKGFDKMTPLEKSFAATDIITHEKHGGELPIDVLAVPFFERPLSRVPVLVQIPGDFLLAGDARERLDLGVYVYAVEESGRLADYFTRSVALDLSRNRERLTRGGLTLYGTCRLPPGNYRLRVLVRDEKDGRYGFQVAQVRVPEFPVQKMQALPPLFVDDRADGVNLRDNFSPGESHREPFRVGDIIFVPQVLPSVMAAKSSRVCLMVYQKPGQTSISPFELEAKILDLSGQSLPAPVSLIGRSAPDEEGLVTLLVRLGPVELPQGEYVFHVTVRDKGDRSVASESESKFRVS